MYVLHLTVDDVTTDETVTREDMQTLKNDWLTDNVCVLSLMTEVDGDADSTDNFLLGGVSRLGVSVDSGC